jgi:hypothetical protein
MMVVATPKGPRLTTFRRGRKNPCRNPRSLVELLWREEALLMLEQRELDWGLRSKPRHMAWDRVVEVFSIKEIGDAVLGRLKARTRLQALPLPG